MAQEDKSIQGEQSTQLLKGLVTDSSRNNQPEGSWRYALNLVNETRNGDKGYVANEYGNTSCVQLTIDGANYIVVGSINLLGDEVVLFLATSNRTESRIVIQSGCSITNVVYTKDGNSASCLNFSEYNPVTGVTKIRKGCNRVIYFRDSLNSDRSIDLDEILNTPDDNRYYNTTDGWNCGLFKMAPDFTVPCIDYITTNNSGGNLKLGVYQFAVALGDENLNFTNTLAVTPPIPIVNGFLNGDVSKIQGGLGTTSTNKSIELQFTNLDQDYQYIKVFVIETVSGVTTAYEAIVLAISGNSMRYTYGGLSYTTAIPATLNSINVPNIIYDKSKTMEQQDQRLLRGNLEERIINHSAWQRAANEISVKYETKPIKYTGNSSVSSGDYYVDNKSLMRDEVYALSIHGVYTDGSITPEYPIPGRALDSISGGFGADPNVAAGLHNRRIPVGLQWDSTPYTVVYGYTAPDKIGNLDYWNEITNGSVFFTPNQTEVNIEDVKHLNKTAGQTVARWEVYNTALREDENSDGVFGSWYTRGELAYWESQLEYPDTVDCSGNRIYPEGKIRHHKMPDTTLEPHFVDINGSTDASGTYIISLGLMFDLTTFNVQLQALLSAQEFSEIQGFVISRAKRDKGNKSVLDKGLSVRSMDFEYKSVNNRYLIQPDLFNKHAQLKRDVVCGERAVGVLDCAYPSSGTTTTYLPDENVWDGDDDDEDDGTFFYSYNKMHVHNPRNKFYSETDVNYIKSEKELFGKIEFWGDDTAWENNDKARASFRTVYNNYHTNVNYKGTPLPLFTNRIISDGGVISLNPAQNTTFDGYNVINACRQESMLADVDNYPDISNDGITYNGGPANMSGSRDNNGDKFDDFYLPCSSYTPKLGDQYSKVYYISLKNYNPSQYGQLYGLTYYPINTCLISTTSNNFTLYGGDCFISQFTFRTTYTDQDFIELARRSWWQNLISYFVESEVNTKLRYENLLDTSQEQQWYYPYRNSIEDVLFLNDEEKAGTGNVETIISNYVAGNYCFNKYNYNQDFSVEQNLKPNYPLPLAYDYCSVCGNEYPYRIVFSEKSYQEDLSDKYRVFPANNYRDISAATGEIFNLFRESDTLFVRTEQSCWYIPTKQQELKTDVGNIQIGTGEFFSLPPKELVSTTIGYNGGQTTLDLVVNEYGALYADASAGIVFLTKTGVGQKEISKDAGNRFWFEQNLPFSLLEFVPNFPYVDSPTSRLGIGLIGYYDPDTRRYILTKKDYYPLYPATTTFDDINKRWLVVVNSKTNAVTDPYNSSLYFENKSWTISYSLEEDMWLSWHSYIPNYAYNTRSAFYTYKQGNNNVWRHGSGDFQTYYGTKYPHVFEFITTKDPLQPKVYNTLSYISDVQEYNTTYKQWIDIKDDTFNKGIFYNSTQSTGEVDIIVKNTRDPFASILDPFTPANIFVERTERVWGISNFRDMVSQTTPEQPIFRSDWTAISADYYTDKVPNSNVINFLTKSQFEMELLRDNYLSTRLSYKNSLNNRRIITKYLTSRYSDSIR